MKEKDILKRLVKNDALFRNIHVITQNYDIIPKDKNHMGAYIEFQDLNELREDFLEELIDSIVDWIYSSDNSIKYVPNKDYKRFTAQLKKVYGAASLKAAESEFERFRQAWSQYPGAVDVWVRNWQHVAQLFSYGSAVRKILYTTNAVESVNSSFRKVTKKGAFPNENALLKLLYLRINELYKKWNRRSQSNWALVRNQLDMDEKIQERIRKYENGGF